MLTEAVEVLTVSGLNGQNVLEKRQKNRHRHKRYARRFESTYVEYSLGTTWGVPCGRLRASGARYSNMINLPGHLSRGLCVVTGLGNRCQNSGGVHGKR